MRLNPFGPQKVPYLIGGVIVAQGSASLPSANLQITKPLTSIFWPVEGSVLRHKHRTITLSPSAIVSSTVTCKSGYLTHTFSIVCLTNLGLANPTKGSS